MKEMYNVKEGTSANPDLMTHAHSKPAVKIIALSNFSYIKL